MALANFFDKAALGAAQALQNFDRAAFVAALDAVPVAVVFDDAAAGSPQGRVTLDLTVNLLARLYPHLVLAPQGSSSNQLAAELAILARAINPDIDIGDDIATTSIMVVVGDTPVNRDVPAIYAGSDGWVVRLSPSHPVGSGATANPFGAAAAACFAAANVFRLRFAEHLPGGSLDDPFILSLLDLVPNAPHPANPEVGPVDLAESHLVGVGAIGNATVWTLARTPGLCGTLHLVDHEVIDVSNLQRYVLATQADVGRAKVAVASAALASAQLDAQPHQERWGDFLRCRQNWNLERVAVAVDSERDRQAVQAALPRWIANAWTQPGDLGVSRHPFLGDQACLTCLYFPDGAGKNEDQLVAEAIGLPSDLMEIRGLLATGVAVGRDLLERIATALGVPIEPLLAFEGGPLRAFYTGAICGGLVLGLGGKTDPGAPQAAVPLAFQSALVGIMLAAELVADAGALRESPPPTTTKIDLLRPLGEHLAVAAAKPASGMCICQDPDYVTRYKAKYG